jgi:cob(I)alamin adenosyltransferase
MDRAMLQIYTGDGKVNTFAATGLALRALSRGLRVLFVDLTSESPEGTPSAMVGIEGFELMGSSVAALHKIKEAMRDRDLVILDGFCGLLGQGLLGEDEAREFIASRPEGVEMVLTGRGAPGWIIEMADLVTEMKDIKHPAQKGVKARKGIEY